MSYRRDIQVNEQTHLPLETTYNSSIDGVVDEVYPNRIHFQYPPEWHTSNVDEKIIGIRAIHLKRKSRTVRFFLYVRKYKKDEFEDNKDHGRSEYALRLMDEIADDLPDDFWWFIEKKENKELHQIINEASRAKYSKTYYYLDKSQRFDIMISTLNYAQVYQFLSYSFSSEERRRIDNQTNNNSSLEERAEIQLSKMKAEDVGVFRIPIQITIDEDDSWEDISDKFMGCISNASLYEYIRSKVIKANDDEVVIKLTELNSIRDDYDLMILRSDEFLENPIPFFVTSDDIIVNNDSKHMKQLIIEQPDNILINNDYYCDYLITPINDSSYTKVYPIPEPEMRSSIYPYLRNTHEVDFDEGRFIHGSDTRNFLNIGPNPNQNHVGYTNVYHRNLRFCNIRTDLDCRIAASFASQSNHNIIGCTNETFENIKYYKINDNGNSFWIECYDNDDINIPINFNNDVVLTMDVVFLQNRKLLYS